MKPETRVVFNTAVLYTKLLVGVALGLFTTRLVLEALGETDFGIYALVGGVVGMLGVLNSSMANASMRFMAHSLGTGDEIMIRKTFNTTLLLHFIIGILVIVIMEVLGLMMFEYLLNIPPDKIYAAKVVFHFMVITTFISIISVPYDAVINSHENLLVLSLVDILGYLLKLGVAIYLSLISNNLLIIYGGLMLIIQILLRIIKQWYSKTKYPECETDFRNYTDRKMFKSILTFSGWNLFGSIAGISVIQVRGILLNMFFGVSINAAEGISKTASSQVNTVATSMTQALNPQLVKSEGSGNRNKMLRLTEIATKFSLFLFALFAIPVMIEANYLLELWLKSVPEYAVLFCQLILLGLFIDKLTFEITSAIRAVGLIKNFQIIETLIVVISVPVSYYLFYTGYPVYSIFIVNIIAALAASFGRLYFGKRIAGMNVNSFIMNGIIPIFIPIAGSILVALLLYYTLPQGIIRLLIITFTSVVVLTALFWIYGVNADESEKLKRILNSLLIKLKV